MTDRASLLARLEQVLRAVHLGKVHTERLGDPVPFDVLDECDDVLGEALAVIRDLEQQKTTLIGAVGSAERDFRAERKRAEDAEAHGRINDEWIRRAVAIAAPFQDDPELSKLLRLGDSTVHEGLRLGIAALKRVAELEATCARLRAERDESLKAKP